MTVTVTVTMAVTVTVTVTVMLICLVTCHGPRSHFAQDWQSLACSLGEYIPCTAIDMGCLTAARCSRLLESLSRYNRLTHDAVIRCTQIQTLLVHTLLSEADPDRTQDKPRTHTQTHTHTNARTHMHNTITRMTINTRSGEERMTRHFFLSTLT